MVAFFIIYIYYKKIKLTGNLMKLTLACDHRTVDGATGAAFLQTLKIFIENPITMALQYYFSQLALVL